MERLGRCIELQGGDRRILDRPDTMLARARRSPRACRG